MEWLGHALAPIFLQLIPVWLQNLMVYSFVILALILIITMTINTWACKKFAKRMGFTYLGNNALFLEEHTSLITVKLFADTRVEDHIQVIREGDIINIFTYSFEVHLHKQVPTRLSYTACFMSLRSANFPHFMISHSNRDFSDLLELFPMYRIKIEEDDIFDEVFNLGMDEIEASSKLFTTEVREGLLRLKNSSYLIEGDKNRLMICAPQKIKPKNLPFFLNDSIFIKGTLQKSNVSSFSKAALRRNAWE